MSNKAKSSNEVRVSYATVLESGSKRLPVSGERCVSFIELPDDHSSGLAYEVRISHHDDESYKSLVGADEIHRFADEEVARAYFATFARAVAGAKANMLLPPTVEGKVSKGE